MLVVTGISPADSWCRPQPKTPAAGRRVPWWSGGRGGMKAEPNREVSAASGAAWCALP